MAAERFHAVGKRKSAVARVWLRPGKGTFTINKKPLEEYIARELDRLVIKQPLELTDTLGKYDISVNVRGGGISGQAGAIRHAISRALLVVNPDYRLPLRRHFCQRFEGEGRLGCEAREPLPVSKRWISF
jgi:small subunit ribosomal protein S9